VVKKLALNGAFQIVDNSRVSRILSGRILIGQQGEM